MTAQDPPTPIRLPLHLKQMGDPENCRHRSGWPYVMEALKSFHADGGILVDDFVERTFQHAYCRQQWREPWIGIFHHPPALPAWLDPSAPPDVIISSPEFRASVRHLKGAIALSEYLAEWLRTALGCPVVALKHPTEVPAARFSIDAFLEGPTRRLIQVGWYGRNQRAIYQVRAPDGFQKIHLLQDRPWVRDAIDRTDALSPHRHRPHVGDVTVMLEVDNACYDELLGSSVIFNQYWDVSASNTVVEAMARGTPLVVNRRPALEEYLGPGYPLFYEDICDVGPLLEDAGRIRAAAGWLEDLDKRWMSNKVFADSIMRFVHEVGVTA